ncbi:MAG: cupin domain-containing protein [Pseudohongiellaceae bacterium]
MIKTRFFILAVGILGAVSLGSIAADSDFDELVNSFSFMSGSMHEGFEILQADEIKWDESSNVLQQVVIHGNPNEEGLYILRARFPAGVTSLPHFHSQDRFVTVIEGTWYAGTDASHDINRTMAIPAGGYMVHPAGSVHFDGANSEAPVIVEIRGMGPVVTEAVPIMR